jgi:L-lactate dehydrogenase complex protein LldF
MGKYLKSKKSKEMKATPTHAAAAEDFLKDEERSHWHDDTLWHVRSNRDTSAEKIPEWENLRTIASQVKDHVLSNLDHLLLQFEKNALENGIEVLWAKDAEEHNQHVLRILEENQVKNPVWLDRKNNHCRH